ncbi:MAG: hypothetical protein H6765_11390 [Candidatus Peribacteria bacterium]|nr:MAG: hypothetical protein H6765_11390 [Candidatus Peribacteria bacterium]
MAAGERLKQLAQNTTTTKKASNLLYVSKEERKQIMQWYTQLNDAHTTLQRNAKKAQLANTRETPSFQDFSTTAYTPAELGKAATDLGVSLDFVDNTTADSPAHTNNEQQTEDAADGGPETINLSLYPEVALQQLCDIFSGKQFDEQANTVYLTRDVATGIAAWLVKNDPIYVQKVKTRHMNKAINYNIRPQIIDEYVLRDELVYGMQILNAYIKREYQTIGNRLGTFTPNHSTYKREGNEYDFGVNIRVYTNLVQQAVDLEQDPLVQQYNTLAQK